MEVRNKTRSPVQLMVRSGKQPRSFTTLIIPGIGIGKNVRLIQDERVVTDSIERLEKSGLISTRYLPNNKVEKGEI